MGGCVRGSSGLWGGCGGRPCTAGSISGLTPDANANIGLGMQQSL